MTPGTKLGPYEILAPIGAGGMGEVYRARDTKLKRDVALKVLPDAFASDPDRMARFQREAEVLASLNHPNIAHIYGVEERALVMELVEGESPKGPMPFDEAWKIAMQMAEALEYAHEKGVVHRDLKPANVKVTPDGVVKLLDFGLAKAFSDRPEFTASDAVNSPTLTMNATVAGVILGTAAYMAPEQAKGKKVDKRADIWSWGVVLYELLTGDRLFKGDDAADTLAQVLTKEPDLQRVPSNVRKLLGRCLEKDPKQRLRDIGDVHHLLDEPAAPSQAVRSRSPLPWIIAAVFAAVAIVTGFITWKHLHEEPMRLVKLSFPQPGTIDPRIPALAVSPDGRRIAFESTVDGKYGLWVRDLDNPAPRMLTALESAPPATPFWAPDSRRLGFFEGSKLKTINVSGGPSLAIAGTGTGSTGLSSGSWNRDDVILFAALGTGAISSVLAGGGTPMQVTEVDKSRGAQHWAPWFLPDGRHFLYTNVSADPARNGVWVGDLRSKARRQVSAAGTNAIYVKPGYLLYVRQGTLVAQPFDAGKFETRGDALTVADQVDNFVATPWFSFGHYSASQNGVLVYMSSGGSGLAQLTWFDHTGHKLGTAGAPGSFFGFSLSPDEKTIALARMDPRAARPNLWTLDLVHGSESLLTFAGYAQQPVWSHDGTQIFFAYDRDGAYKLYRKAANGTGAEEVLAAGRLFSQDASRDGRYLIAARTAPDEIWVLPLFGDRKPFSYLSNQFVEGSPRLSPDGRWLAYGSNETGNAEIYVVSFPQRGGKWQISAGGGGIDPVWSTDGRELYYYDERKGELMAVDIKAGAQFQFGVPKLLFPVTLDYANGNRFEVTKDGRFLIPLLQGGQSSAPMAVVLNWPEILRKK